MTYAKVYAHVCSAAMKTARLLIICEEQLKADAYVRTNAASQTKRLVAAEVRTKVLLLLQNIDNRPQQVNCDTVR